MDLIIILGAISIAAYLINKLANSTLISVIGVAAFVSLVIYLIAIMFLYYTTKEEIKDYYALEIEIQDARLKGSIYENTALQVKIRDTNEWLADAQEWNRTMFELCIPDEINDLKPLPER